MLRFSLGLLGVFFAAGAGFGAPTITVHPDLATATAGSTATLTVSASGSGPLTHQWRKFGVPISGATNATLMLPVVDLVDAGFYDVVVSDGGGATTSQGGEIRVTPPYYPNRLRPVTSFAPRFESRGGAVRSVAAASAGRFYAAGIFTRIGAVDTANIARFNANGSLDTSFAPPRLSNTAVERILVQPDGKLVVLTGFRTSATGIEHRLFRLNANGSIDSTFAFAPGFEGTITAITLQPDGKILFAGLRVLQTTPGGGYAGTPHISRLLTNGSLDASFALDASVSGTVSAMSVQADGRIVALGRLSIGGGPTWGIVRLNAAGTIDPTFQGNASGLGGFAAMLLLPDGKIVAAQNSSVLGATTPRPYARIYRLSQNGALDTAFDGGGDLSVWVTTLDLQSDGKILIGWGGTPHVIRRLANGAPDPTFQTSDVGVPADLAVLSDGRLVVGLAPFPEDFTDKLVARLLANGSRDPLVNPSFRAPGAVIAALPDRGGGWWVGGVFDFVNGVPAGMIVRLAANGTIAAGFATGVGFNNGVMDLLMQGDGKILCAGRFTEFDGVAVKGVVRLTGSGLRDATFTPSLPDATVVVSRLALQPDGRILASVVSESFGGGFRASFGRWNPDGTLDPTYQPAATFMNSVRAILPFRDGTALVAGALGFGRDMAKLNRDGTVANDFFADTTWSGSVKALAGQVDGKLVVAGSISTNAPPLRENIGRMNSDGSTDGSFAVGTGFNNPVTRVHAQANGDILVVGEFDAFNEQSTPAVARLNNDGSLDDDFEIRGLTPDANVNFATYTSNSGLLLGGGFGTGGGGWTSYGDFVGRGLVLFEPVPEPLIRTQPVSPPAAVAGGSAVGLSVDAVSNGPVSYQWQVHYPGSIGFADVPGANSAALAFPVPQRFHDGTYRVVITANGSSITSAPVTLTVNPATPSPEAHLLNLSTRALCQTGDNVLIPGFVISGSANKKLLIRAVGPTLGMTPFHLPGVLPNPRMTLKRWNPALGPKGDYVTVTTNDNWETNANVAAIIASSAELGAFALSHPNDAALLLDLEPGQYTVVADDVANATGIAMVELYDADADGSGSRLINISNRGYTGAGASVMIPGFVVSSEGPKTFLIRAVGPTLAGAPFNVGGALADPQFVVYRSNGDGTSTVILTQNNWGENPDSTHTAQIATQVSAFALASNSKDAAFVATLPPGLYTVHGQSADGIGTGVVLVEIYVVE